MSKRFNLYKIIVFSVIFTFAIHVAVYAAGDLKLSADKSSCAVSDEIKVTLKADNPADASVAPEISITFDPNRLSFKDCTCAYGGGGGGLITLNETNADITFSVLSGGTAVVEASAVFDGDGANTITSSVSISVEGEDTASNVEVVETTDLGIEGGSIAGLAPDKLVAAVFADEFMPAGFFKTSVTYEEQLVEAAQFDMGNITLLYVTDMDGNNGNFNVYSQETGEFSDFVQIKGIENKFIIVLRAKDAGSDVPEGFSLATLNWNDMTLDAYSNDSVPDFVLLYAVSSEGNKGWYLYDQKDGTYQRFVNELYSNTSVDNSSDSEDPDMADDEEDEDEDDSDSMGFLDKKIAGIKLSMLFIIILSVISVCLLVTVIIMGVKQNDFDGDEYLEGEPAVPNPAPAQSPKMTASELVSREMNSDIKTRAREPLEKQNNAVKPDIASVPEENIYEKYRKESESKAIEDDYTDDEFLSRDEKKALKAEEKARKKAEKKMKKEYGEFGPANFSEWQQVVRDDRKVSEEEILEAQSMTMEMPVIPPTVTPHVKEETNDTNINIEDINNEETDSDETAPVSVADLSMPSSAYVAPPKSNKQEASTKDDETMDEQAESKKDSYAKMLKKLPANDKNEPVQPKPVQQFDLDDDFEFEYINLDDDDE